MTKFVSQEQLDELEKDLEKEKLDLLTKPDLKVAIAELRVEMKDIKVDILKWILPFLVTIIGLIVFK